METETVQKPEALWRHVFRLPFPIKVVLTILVCALVLLIPYFVVTGTRKPRTVDLGYVRLRGQTLHSGVEQYLGIRYAAPPIGNLRFAAPIDPEPMGGSILDAKRVITNKNLILSLR
jgi:hypothetical protein